jgi:triacylglycerol lipase
MKLSLVLALATLLAATGASHARKPQDSPSAPLRRVVLVHGFLETGSTFNRLKRRLEKHGVVCLVPKLHPSDGRGGLESIAARLKQDIDTAFGPDQQISIIAFSMGGLVSRHYLQNLGGAARCRQLFTISSPHHGTKAAWCYPTKGAEQMRPGSGFLAELEQSEAHLGNMPVVSYRTPMDLVILPPTSSVWKRAENLEFPVILHPMMVSSTAVMADIEQRLLRVEP